MKDTDFTFAVARVRVAENSLLSSGGAERLASASSDSEVKAVLAEKGYDVNADSETMLSAAEKQLNEFIGEISPNSNLMNFVFIKNDFHNLKTALKDLVTSNDNSAGYGPSGTVPAENIIKAVKNKNFSLLPTFLEKRAETAYEILVKTYDGQLADIYLDRETLIDTVKFAEQSECELAVKAAKYLCTAADIKTALRAVYTGKDSRFLEKALSDAGNISAFELISACSKGADGLIKLLEDTGYSAFAESIKVSPAVFEKVCDDILMDAISSAKFKSFGQDPIIAYYFAKLTEIKNIRIILSCRRLGVPIDEIKQRVRKMYV